MTDHALPDYLLPELERRLSDLNRRAVRLDLPSIALTVTGHEFRPNHARDEWGRPSSKCDGTFTRWLTVSIVGADPVVVGWRFVAQLQHHAQGNIIRNLSGVPLPEQYRQSEANCDHCRLYRLRAVTYVLVNDAGSYCQVGSSCLSDFTGHGDPQAIADYLVALDQLCRDVDAYADDDCAGGGGKRLIPTELYLCHVAAVVRVHGWLSRGAAADMQILSTSERAIDQLLPSPFSPPEPIPVLDADRAVATSARAWACANDDQSEYDHNLRVCCAEDYTDPRNLGLLASAVNAWQRATQKAQAAAANPSEWAGSVGDKIKALPVTVTRVNLKDGIYGTTSIVSMLAGDNVLTWFASRVHEYTIGGTYLLSGTVKATDLYQGVKQTIVTRCKLTEVI